ncbi:MAG: HAD-IC family P-type ATPase, partial [Planctomycetota bacterium]
MHDDGDMARPEGGADGLPRALRVIVPWRIRLGPYSELLWPAIAAVGLVGGWILDAGPAALAFYALAYLAGGWEACVAGVRQLRKFRLDIDFLMVLAAVGAALVGEFGEGALLLFLFSLGHGLEHLALDRARSAVKALAGLAPKSARVRDPDGSEREVPADQVVPGTLVVVRPGERIAADGEVVEGRSGVDQSPITGESMPVDKEPGAAVFAGSLNGDGALVVRANRPAGDTLVARMVRLVAEAQSSKSLAERAAERFTRFYGPCVLVATLLAVVVPPLAGWLAWKEAVVRAMSMLIGASPCALAISTPAAVLAGLARAARGGVLVKGGAHLESLGLVRAIAVDKT